jgi:hypothetical protein
VLCVPYGKGIEDCNMACASSSTKFAQGIQKCCCCLRASPPARSLGTWTGTLGNFSASWNTDCKS